VCFEQIIKLFTHEDTLTWWFNLQKACYWTTLFSDNVIISFVILSNISFIDFSVHHLHAILFNTLRWIIYQTRLCFGSQSGLEAFQPKAPLSCTPTEQSSSSQSHTDRPLTKLNKVSLSAFHFLCLRVWQ